MASTTPKGYEFYSQVLGCPKYINLLASMAKGRYGAQLVYTPMINTKVPPLIEKQSLKLTNIEAPSDKLNSAGEEGNTFRYPLLPNFASSPRWKICKDARKSWCSNPDIVMVEYESNGVTIQASQTGPKSEP
ncbi:hypothetical protein JOM56_014403 [Amanita muscaria]